MRIGQDRVIAPAAGGSGVLLAPPSYAPLSSIPNPSGERPERAFFRQVRECLGSNRFAVQPLLDRTHDGIEMLRRYRLGGVCWARPMPAQPTSVPSFVIVAPSGVALGGDSAARQAERMIEAAGEYPGNRVVLLLEGLPLAQQIRFRAAARGHGWIVPQGHVAPWDLLERADVVLTDGAIIGFLGLLAGKRVRCFGACFYGGWGLTEDQPQLTPNPMSRSLAELFAAALLVVPRYRDPFRGTPTSFEQACEVLAGWRQIDAANQSVAACLGMSFWKRRQIGDMLRSSAGRPAMCRSVGAALRHAKTREGGVAVWASREPAGLAQAAHAAGVPVMRIEDGFVRSVGLGADFVPAASIIVDRSGIYYDPNRPSDFQGLAAAAEFGPDLLDRARRLAALLVERGITKYNTGKLNSMPGIPTGMRRIFVPGQVENDRSVLSAGAGVKGNLDLLRRVRAANPNAYIVYKPHPDVDAGHRPGDLPDSHVEHYANAVIRGISSAELIEAVDEVHTLTSLTGFEALLRGRVVVVYGQPFYAGWGLTTDLAPAIPGRTRPLTLDQLVATTLILYPRYLDPLTRLPCGPELIIERLGQKELWHPSLLVQLRRFYGSSMARLRRTRVPPRARAA